MAAELAAALRARVAAAVKESFALLSAYDSIMKSL
jgi:hypothetical protein